MAGNVRAFGTLKYLAGIAVPTCTTCKYTGWDHSQDQSSMSIGQSLWGFMDRWTLKSRRSCVHKDLQSHCVLACKRHSCIQDTSQARGSVVPCRPYCHSVCRQCLMVRLQCAAHAERDYDVFLDRSSGRRPCRLIFRPLQYLHSSCRSAAHNI